MGKLFHNIPNWVGDDAIFFVTLCCEKRYYNSLAKDSVAAAVSESLLFYQTRKDWWVHLWLLMPDHVHGLISLGSDTNFEKLIMNWKRYITKKTGAGRFGVSAPESGRQGVSAPLQQSGRCGVSAPAQPHPVKWQTNFFDHRLRNDESLLQKMNYILNNPVRAGLVEQEKDWKYVWIEGIGR